MMRRRRQSGWRKAVKHGYLVVGLATLLSVGPAAATTSIVDLNRNRGPCESPQERAADRRLVKTCGRSEGAGAATLSCSGARRPPVDKPIRNWPHLSVSFDVPSADTYEVVLHYTSAPDFGTFRVSLGGRPVADIDAYGPAVTPQDRGLGQHKLGPARHELLVTVFGKAARLQGFFSRSGPDRTAAVRRCHESSPGAERKAVIQEVRHRPLTRLEVPPAGRRTQFRWRQRHHPEVDREKRDGHDIRPDQPDRTPGLGIGTCEQARWRWQVALQPFSGPVSGSPPGLVAEREVSTRDVLDRSRQFPAAERQDAATGRETASTIDFYIRLVATNGGQPAGVGSNAVVAHYVPGSDRSLEIGRDALKKAEEEKQRRKRSNSSTGSTPLKSSRSSRQCSPIRIAGAASSL